MTEVKKESFFHKIFHIVSEPMFLLLIISAIIYFILGEPRDGAVMLVFVAFIISIEVIQEWKTDKTLNTLKELSAPKISVIRDNAEKIIPSAELVPGDLMIISEGVKIPADGFIIKSNDLCVDESSLTGESEAVWKGLFISNSANIHVVKSENTEYWRKDYCYATLVIQGGAYISVDKTGALTEYGKIGANVSQNNKRKTLLQKQTGSLVKICSFLAGIFCLLTILVTFFNLTDHIIKDRIIKSVLSGITLAMAVIPEEFPVVLAVFLSLGAWRLAKKNSLIRKLSSVEALGAVSVLCVDKTGTITQNQMTVHSVWADNGNSDELCEIMGLACETDAYDNMEKAMLAHCEQRGITKKHLFDSSFVSEYAFTNDAKMMGHVWVHENEIIIAAKGSPESILKICDINSETLKKANDKIYEMSEQGLRVIAVASMKPKNKLEIPTRLNDCSLILNGLVGLYDPPRETVKDDIKRLGNAGIRVVMITGDNGITASSIAKQIGMVNCDKVITGGQLSDISDEELRKLVKSVNIFSRVLPEHKTRIVKAFKDNGETVAMTGDGVNDAPALKFADIGIAMGKRGAEVSREAADLILLDDNFSTIIDTIKDGRRIYDNIRKAIGYIFSIHIPIAFAALFAPLFKISPQNLLFMPIHVVLMELIIDPTCSVVLERQPPEDNIMTRPPRGRNEKILTVTTVIKSLIQGLVILAASFGSYLFLLGKSPELARTFGIAVLIIANIFLVLVNSADNFVIRTVKILYKDNLMRITTAIMIAGLLLIIYTPISDFLKLTPLSFWQITTAAIIAAASTLWYEIVKIIHIKIRPCSIAKHKI